MTRSQAICSSCGRKGTRVRKISRAYGTGAKEFLVRNIPTINCPHCGESFLTAETLHELERIKTHPGKLAEKRKIAVVEFPGGGDRRIG